MDRLAAGLRKAKERAGAASGAPPPVAKAEEGAAWADLPRFDPDPATMERHRIVTFARTDPACAAFDIMRTKLLFLVRRNGWRSVGITSPGDGCGKTTTSLNLAFGLAQMGVRVLLADLDLRRPAVARLLGLERAGSMAEVLTGARRPAEGFVRCGETLVIGTSAAPIRNSADVLLGAAAAQVVADLARAFAPDVILYDLPPMLVTDDVLAFTPHLDCVLLIAEAEATRLDEVWACQVELTGHCGFVGVVVNKCRYDEAEYAYGTGRDHSAAAR